jgi:hypothetical protein
LKVFRDNNIECINVPPSNSGIHQACDEQTTFKGTKKEVKRVRKNDIDVRTGKDHIVSGIRNAFESLKLAFPGLGVGATHIENIIAGILTIFHSYTKNHDPTVYIGAFKRCGQHCERDPVTHSTIDYKVLMNRCYTTADPAELDYVLAISDRLINQYVIPNGRMSYADMLAENFIPGPTTIDRDNLAAMRRGPQIMTHASTQARQVEWVRTHSQEFIDNKKQEAADAKVIQQAEAKRVKDANKKAIQDTKKQAQQQAAIDFRELSPAQQEEHKAAVRVAKSAKRNDNVLKRKAEEDAYAEKEAGARARQEARQSSNGAVNNSMNEDQDQDQDEDEDEEE